MKLIVLKKSMHSPINDKVVKKINRFKNSNNGSEKISILQNAKIFKNQKYSLETPFKWLKMCFDSTTNTSNKSASFKTKRTQLKMMEEHRNNERVRHHNLNATIDSLVKRVPGFADFEFIKTKIVKLQLVINYICHLEKNIKELCQDLGVNVNFNTIFLSSAISEKTIQESFFTRNGKFALKSSKITSLNTYECSSDLVANSQIDLDWLNFNEENKYEHNKKKFNNNNNELIICKHNVNAHHVEAISANENEDLISKIDLNTTDKFNNEYISYITENNVEKLGQSLEDDCKSFQNTLEYIFDDNSLLYNHEAIIDEAADSIYDWAREFECIE